MNGIGVYEGRAKNEAEYARQEIEKADVASDIRYTGIYLARAQVHATLAVAFATLAHGVSIGFRLGGIEQAVKEAGGQS